MARRGERLASLILKRTRSHAIHEYWFNKWTSRHYFFDRRFNDLAIRHLDACNHANQNHESLVLSNTYSSTCLGADFSDGQRQMNRLTRMLLAKTLWQLG